MEWRQAECGREILCGERAGGVLMQGDLRTADLTGFAGKVQCVYLDPPFFTGDEFEFRMRIGEKGWTDGSQTLTLKAYSDSRTGGRAQYLLLLREALRVAYDLLSDTGALFLHLDSRMNAYARLECDQVFGENNFVNEIIWAYQSGGRAKRHFSRKHDVILFYAKSRALYFDITRVGVPRKDNRSNHMRRTVDEHGRPCRTIRAGGKVYTYYDDEPVFPDDVWTDVSHLQQKDPPAHGLRYPEAPRAAGSHHPLLHAAGRSGGRSVLRLGHRAGIRQRERLPVSGAGSVPPRHLCQPETADGQRAGYPPAL